MLLTFRRRGVHPTPPSDYHTPQQPPSICIRDTARRRALCPLCYPRLTIHKVPEGPIHSPTIHNSLLEVVHPMDGRIFGLCIQPLPCCGDMSLESLLTNAFRLYPEKFQDVISEPITIVPSFAATRGGKVRSRVCDSPRSCLGYKYSMSPLQLFPFAHPPEK